MKKFILGLCILCISAAAKAQGGYDIKINLEGCTDTTLYLVKYTFDQQFMADTCKKVKNGHIEFKGNNPLDKGMYALVSPAMSKYFDFFVNESEKFTLTAVYSDMANTMKSPDSRENELMFSYAKFMTAKEQEYKKLADQKEKQKAISNEVKKFTENFAEKNKGTFVYDFLNLRVEKFAKDVPKASNGRPDSLYQYYYYKSHYLDGINFKDNRIVHTPFFADRIKKYISEVIVQSPDTVIHEADKLLTACDEGNQVYNALLGYFTYTFEQKKTMSFDRAGKAITFEKVFVHLADHYITNGHADGIYSKETIAKIKERADITRNLLPEATVSELFMIDTVYGRQVLKMGFDTASSNKSVTDLYYKNIEKLTPMLKTLYQVNAKYTILVFWAIDCDHCKTEIPKLNDALKELKGKVDVKVFAVQTKDDQFEEWKKFIVNNKLNFINVFDPVHLNNTKERFDITSTPMIYLLDKEKRIKGKRLNAEQTIEIIKNLETIEKL